MNDIGGDTPFDTFNAIAVWPLKKDLRVYGDLGEWTEGKRVKANTKMKRIKDILYVFMDRRISGIKHLNDLSKKTVRVSRF